MKTNPQRENARLQSSYNMAEQSTTNKDLPYSQQALEKINEFTDTYGASLTKEAQWIGKRQNVDQVSAVDVKTARDNLYSRNQPEEINKILAGALLGVGFSTFLSPLIKSLPSEPILVIGGLLLLLGGILAAK